MPRRREVKDGESPYWWREFEEVYWTNQFHRSPLRRPTGVKVKYMAEPIEGRICYACGSLGHRKENCEYVAKGGTCTYCGEAPHRHVLETPQGVRLAPLGGRSGVSGESSSREPRGVLIPKEGSKRQRGQEKVVGGGQKRRI